VGRDGGLDRGADRPRGAGLPARHREAVGAIRDALGIRWLGQEPLADRPRIEIVRIRAGVALGVLFLAGTISDIGDESVGPSLRIALGVGIALFIGIYMSVLPPVRWLSRRGPGAVIAALALLPVIAIALLAAGAPPSFSALFVYVAAATGMLLPPRTAAGLILATGVGVGILGAVRGDEDGAVAATVLTVVAIGSMMAAFGRVTRVNRELRDTREELATLAVADERLRIARDVHDLLGHSLSVITLKSELAARLLERDPARAADELEEIQAVSREALAEVREAVKGYRGLALSESLTRARSALTAAGIDCELAGAQPALPADVDAVLAWAVREGTTNVIRHSQASHCEIRIRADGESAALEIDDDGRPAAAPGTGGSGLDGLRERAQRVRGTLEAGARPGGGFRLRVTVPLPEP
jgi:two-component system, NarL family, sensor histidine kinase DesK